jgi:hypothetical protein
MYHDHRSLVSDLPPERLPLVPDTFGGLLLRPFGQTRSSMIGLLLVCALAAAEPDAGPVLREIQQSHTDANVPHSSDFDKFLVRDLAEYFSTARHRVGTAVEYEPLRRGPTHSGVSYPKFYLWVRIDGGKNPQDRGAVRVAAIEKKRFEVTDFVSEEAILKDFDQLYTVFPAAVCETIKERMRLISSSRRSRGSASRSNPFL